MNSTRIKKLIIFAIVLLTVSVGASAQTPSDWPQWRGANRDGISKETGLFNSGRKMVHRCYGKQPAPVAAIRPSRFQRANLHNGSPR